MTDSVNEGFVGVRVIDQFVESGERMGFVESGEHVGFVKSGERKGSATLATENTSSVSDSFCRLKCIPRIIKAAWCVAFDMIDLLACWGDCRMWNFVNRITGNDPVLRFVGTTTDWPEL